MAHLPLRLASPLALVSHMVVPSGMIAQRPKLFKARACMVLSSDPISYAYTPEKNTTHEQRVHRRRRLFSLGASAQFLLVGEGKGVLSMYAHIGFQGRGILRMSYTDAIPCPNP